MEIYIYMGVIKGLWKRNGSCYLGFRLEDGDLPVYLDVLGYKAVYTSCTYIHPKP